MSSGVGRDKDGLWARSWGTDPMQGAPQVPPLHAITLEFGFQPASLGDMNICPMGPLSQVQSEMDLPQTTQKVGGSKGCHWLVKVPE